MNNRTYGYFHIVIRSSDGSDVLFSNDERAFVISQLQDSLSPRLFLLDIPEYKQLASCIDLLAFSIYRNAIHLILFSVDISITKQFVHRLCGNLRNYQFVYHTKSISLLSPHRLSFGILAGPHHALSRTVDIHLLQPDWEYSRYSSIGFYLHDRRGDWMRFWRLANLYNNDPLLYRKLIYNHRDSNVLPRNEFDTNKKRTTN